MLGQMTRYGFLLLVLVGLARLCSGQTSSEIQFEGTLAMPLYEAGYVLNWDAPRYSTFNAAEEVLVWPIWMLIEMWRSQWN
jgi:hypothetical protein